MRRLGAALIAIPGAVVAWDYSTRSKMRRLKTYNPVESLIRVSNLLVSREPFASWLLPLVSLEELSTMARKKACFSAGGVVYDVSSSGMFDREGPYAVFSGCDATVALATTSLDPSVVNSRSWTQLDLCDDERDALASWIAHFDEKYRRVARLREYRDSVTEDVNRGELLRRGWSLADVEQLDRLLCIDGVQGHYSVRCVKHGQPPQLGYDRIFAEAVTAQVEATGDPVGPAPLLPHTQMVPLRLRALGDAKVDAVKARVPSSTIRRIDRGCQACMDLCFWRDDPLQSRLRDKNSGVVGARLTYDDLKSESKTCFRGCVDAAVAELSRASSSQQRVVAD